MRIVTSSDWHLRETVPVSRNEPDWYSVMDSKISALFEFAGTDPLVIAGDIFDKSCPSARLVSWAMSVFTTARCPIYTVPGQHDLQFHRYADRMNGAYGVLVKAGLIIDLPANEWVHVSDDVSLYGMPWGHYNLPQQPSRSTHQLCVLHKYLWSTKATRYVGAGAESNIVGLSEYSQHFTGIAAGDNHIAFSAGPFINHGSLFGFASNQKDHVPFVGILTDDGYAAHRFPDPVPALWQPNLVANPTQEVNSVVEYLATADSSQVNFRESLRRLGEENKDAGQRAVYDELNNVLSR